MIRMLKEENEKLKAELAARGGAALPSHDEEA